MAKKRLTEALTDPTTGLTSGLLTKYGREVCALAKSALTELRGLNIDDIRSGDDPTNPFCFCGEGRYCLGMALALGKKPNDTGKKPGEEAEDPSP